MLTDEIGPGFLTDLYRLEALRPRVSDELCDRFHALKQLKKAQLSAEILHSERCV